MGGPQQPLHWIAIAILSTTGFGIVGFIDDYLKVVRRSHHGLWPRYKMGGQLLVATGVGIAVLVLADQNPPLYNTRLIFPFFKNLIPDLGVAYVLFAAFVLVAWSNAVNLTDGLDGLAISTFAVAATAFTARVRDRHASLPTTWTRPVSPAGGCRSLRRARRRHLVSLYRSPLTLHGRCRLPRARRRARACVV